MQQSLRILDDVLSLLETTIDALSSECNGDYAFCPSFNRLQNTMDQYTKCMATNNILNVGNILLDDYLHLIQCHDSEKEFQAICKSFAKCDVGHRRKRINQTPKCLIMGFVFNITIHRYL